MRGATECARRVKLLFSSLRSKLGKVGLPAVTDPVTQMLLGILSRNVPESKAREGLDRLRAIVVDYNELRVIAPIELAELLADFPDARLKCEDITRALNAVFAREHSVVLEQLAERSRRDALAYLQKIEGLEPYTIARIRLLGLRQHAIPLDEAMWALTRREELVNARCPLDEAQQFLERQISEDDALEFVALLKRHAWNELGTAVKRGEVERIQSVPPDRSARNMLQMISSATAGADEDDLELVPDEALVEAVAAPDPATAKSPRRPRPAAGGGDTRARRGRPGRTRPATARGGGAGGSRKRTPRTPAARAEKSPRGRRRAESRGRGARRGRSAKRRARASSA